MPPRILTPVIVACALFMENLDSTVIATSLPAIARDMGEDPIALKLALTSYLLSLAVFIPVSGWAADRYGAKNVFRAALLVFMAGSLACGFSVSLLDFVMARIVQGIGGAMMVPVGRLVVLRTVPKGEFVSALAWFTIPALIGPILGPPVGGFITTYAHWRWIFFINIPIGLLGILLVTRFIGDIREENTPPLDVRGLVLLGLGLSGLVFGLAVMGQTLMPLWLATVITLAGLGFCALYALHAPRKAHPVLDLRLLRIATFRANVIGGSLFRIGTGATPFLLPLLFQEGFGLTPFASGGFFRSLQFTAINTIAYADIPPAAMSQATSFASAAQQVSLSLGVAVAALILQTVRDGRGGTGVTVGDFTPAFLLVALISALCVVVFARLSGDAGAELSGRAVAEADTVRPTPATP
jgi:EmrB/QacA subfamily drug resistance transporter